MPRTLLLALSLVSALAPLPAAAQSPGPDYAPIELTADDVGAWDVVMTARGPFGTMTVKGTETNTVGCDGRCIVTKAGGQLKSVTMRRGSSAPWWRDADGGGAGSNLSLKQTGLREAPDPRDTPVSIESPALPTRVTTRTVNRTDGNRTIRASVEYPDADHRIVTTFLVTPNGQATQTARVVYTRRKQATP